MSRNGSIWEDLYLPAPDFTGHHLRLLSLPGHHFGDLLEVAGVYSIPNDTKCTYIGLFTWGV